MGVAQIEPGPVAKIRVVRIRGLGKMLQGLIVRFFFISRGPDVVIQSKIVRIPELSRDKMIPGGFIFTGFISLQTFGDIRKNRPGQNRVRSKARHPDAQSHDPAPSAGKNPLDRLQHKFNEQKNQGRQQKPLEPFFPDLPAFRCQGFALHLPQNPMGVNQVHILVPGHGTDINPTRDSSQLFKARFIHPGQNHAAGRVFFKPPVVIGYRSPLERTHAQTENRDTLPGRGFGGLPGVAPGAFAIGDDQNNFTGVGCFFKRIHTGTDGFGQMGPAHGQISGGQRLEKNMKRLMIQGQGTLQQGSSGKSHQSDPVGFHHAQQVDDFSFGPLHSIGFDILCQHTPGTVQGDHDIHPLLLNGFPAKPPSGAGQGRQGQDCRRQKKTRLDPSPGRIISRNQSGEHIRVGKSPQHLPPCQYPVNQDAGQGNQSPHQAQKFRTGKRHVHGILRHRVPLRTACTSNRARPTDRTPGYSS